MRQLGHRAHVGEHPRRRLGVNDADRRITTRRETTLEVVEVEGLAPGSVDDVDVPRAGLRDLGEAARESAVHEGEDWTRGCVAHGPLHQPARRGRADVHGPRREKHVAESDLEAGKELLELTTAMRDHRPRHGRENLRADFGWSREEEGAERYGRKGLGAGARG